MQSTSSLSLCGISKGKRNNCSLCSYDSSSRQFKLSSVQGKTALLFLWLTLPVSPRKVCRGKLQVFWLSSHGSARCRQGLVAGRDVVYSCTKAPFISTFPAKFVSSNGLSNCRQPNQNREEEKNSNTHGMFGAD